MKTGNKKLTTLTNKIHTIAKSRVAAGYEDRDGICEHQVMACTDTLTLLGGSDFADSYLPFLRNVNGFDLNGVRLFGYFDDKDDNRDLRKQLADLKAIPEFFPDMFNEWVLVGETDTDIIIFNKKNGAYENRDRIGLDRLNESYDDITGLLLSLIPLIE